jgi:hypothetical protein
MLKLVCIVSGELRSMRHVKPPPYEGLVAGLPPLSGEAPSSFWRRRPPGLVRYFLLWQAGQSTPQAIRKLV